MSHELPQALREALLAEGGLYEVGGSVRDRFLGRALYDRDYLVTGIALPDLVRMLSRFGYADLVGRSFGVVKFTFHPPDTAHSVTVDIALPRRERSTGPGHRDFEVDFDPSLPIEEDLVRRDFTVNALAIDLGNGSLIDPTGGRRDIEEMRLRLISPRAIEEDPLRMLRALGLVARFEFRLDPPLEAALHGQAGLLGDVAPERIAEEFTKILTLAPKPSLALRLLETTGMLDVLIPELRPAVGCDQPGPYHAYDVFEHSLRVVDAAPPRLALRWAALLHDVDKPRTKEVREDKVTFYNHDVLGAETARRILNRLRYGHELATQVSVLIERHLFNTDMGDRGLRRLIRAVGVDRMDDLLDLRRADVEGQGMGASTADVDAFAVRVAETLAARPPFTRTELAVDGHALMEAFDLPPGPQLGETLNHLLERVLDEPERNDRETLLKWAAEFLHRGVALVAPVLLSAVVLLGG
jgi:tRNA nucleotidyltransferase (CCA-adding enzyme)